MLFADLSGYTAIAEQLDPEDTKALVDGALRRLSREVTDRGGHVDKYIGDNVMAVFGAPVAHEDDPERAVRAGLAMQAAMSEINAEIGGRAATSGVELALRVGINSGEVLAGRMGDQYMVIGDTVNVAARLQAASGIGAVTVGAATRRLTAAAIEYRDLEPLDLKGKSQPIPAWEALGIADPAARSRSRPTAAPLVGRQEELSLLLSLFERAVKESRPYLVTVFGQAGVGKSRLLTELATALAERADPAETLVGHSPAYGTATTYSALGEILRERFGISRAEPPQVGVAKLVAGIEDVAGQAEGVDATRTAAQIARMLGIDDRGEARDDVDPEQVRDRIFAAVRLVLELLSERAPLVLAIEDIHWADESMLDLIEHLAGWGRGPVLIVCLARDELLERRPSWGGGRRNATTISLDALSGEEAQDLVRSLFAGQEGGAELAQQVAERSGGNPLFAEEMVNRLREEEDVVAARAPRRGAHGHPDAADGRPGGDPAAQGTRHTARIIVLTTFDTDEMVLTALQLGAAGFLLKDTPPADLVVAVRRVALGEPMLSPSVTTQLIAAVTRPSDDGRRRKARTLLARLTEREREVADAVSDGMTNTEIARSLHLGRRHGEDARGQRVHQAGGDQPRAGGAVRARRGRRPLDAELLPGGVDADERDLGTQTCRPRLPAARSST